MFEILFLFGILLGLGALALVLLKVLVALFLLPFKIAFWVVKGFLSLIIAIPLAVIFVNVFSLAFPLLFLILLAPIIIGGLVLIFLFKFILGRSSSPNAPAAPPSRGV